MQNMASKNQVLRPKQINYIFLRHRSHHLQVQPPTSEIFIPFPVFTLKNHLYIAYCQFKLAIICFWLVGRLVGKQLVAAHMKSWKFPEITWIHHFYSILFKKIKI